MQLNLRGNRVAIEKIKKVNKGVDKLGLVMPESEEYLGYIRYVGADAAADLQVGQKVYFSTNYQPVRMGGVDLCIMEDTQVYAAVNE